MPIELPAAGNYAVGVFFFSQNKKKSNQQKLLIEKAIKKSPLDFLCWREVPTNNQCLSKNDLGREPCVYHLFVTTKNSKKLSKAKLSLQSDSIIGSNSKKSLPKVLLCSCHSLALQPLMLPIIVLISPL